jgi:hypothetical protein
MHTSKRLLPEASAFEAEVAIGKLKGHKSPGFGHTSAELIQAEGKNFVRRFMNSLN